VDSDCNGIGGVQRFRPRYVPPHRKCRERQRERLVRRHANRVARRVADELVAEAEQGAGDQEGVKQPAFEARLAV